MRICLATPEYAGVTPESGGIGTQFAAMAEQFARRGHDVHVVTPLDGAAPAGVDCALNVHVVPAAGAGALATPRNAIAADRRIREIEPLDVVFAPEWAGLAWRYAARRPRAPLVTNLATSSAQILALTPGAPRRSRVDPRVVVPRVLERQQARRSDAIVACSRAILDWACELWPIEDVPQSVIPNAVDVTRVQALAAGPFPADLGPWDGPVIAAPGRLEPRKGSHVLAQALSNVAEQVPDVRLVLIGKDGGWGDGPMSDYMRSVAGSRADRMAFVGHQPPERLFPLLARASVVAVPSLWEAFGLTALEGMALAKPVVVTSGSGFDDFCDDGSNCLAVPPGNAEALAAALLRLLTEPELAATIGDAASATAERLDVEHVGGQLLELLARTAGQEEANVDGP